MTANIFYSWQSDIRPVAACRSLIEDALEQAIRTVANDGSIGLQPVLDRDTADVPGCPDIGITIFEKIEEAAAFVADVTIVNAGMGRPMPNPNVLLELGYALHALGDRRIVLVQNIAFGKPEQLPFDLRQKRVITYHSEPDASERASARKALSTQLERALRAVLLNQHTPSRAEVELTLPFERNETAPDRHHYRIKPTLTNIGKRRIDDWQLELEFPSRFLDSTTYGSKDERLSSADVSVFRRDGREGRGTPLYPGRAVTLQIGYVMTTTLYHDERQRFSEPVRARAFVDGELVAEHQAPFSEFQEF